MYAKPKELSVRFEKCVIESGLSLLRSCDGATVACILLQSSSLPGMLISSYSSIHGFVL